MRDEVAGSELAQDSLGKGCAGCLLSVPEVGAAWAAEAAEAERLDRGVEDEEELRGREGPR